MRCPRPSTFPLLLLVACAAHQAASPGPSAAAPPPSTGPSDAGPAAAAGGQFGVVDFPVSCSPAARAQFELGVSQLHSFFYPETVKTFGRVVEMDPGCAIAYWGLAFAQMPNPLVPPFDPAALRRAAEAVEKGLALARTERERDWLAAEAPLFRDAATVDQFERNRRYAAAMEALAAKYPDDVEAQVFLALALLQAADLHDRGFTSQFRAARILKALEASHPGHPGIAHYEIHAYDHAPIASLGLAAADAYAEIAPSAPHAVHMPSHVYSMLGMWDRSIASNQATIVVATDYARRNFAPGVTHAAVPHSLDFLEYAFLQEGRDGEALQVVADARAVEKLNVTTLAQAAGLAAVPVRYALERSAWAEAAGIPVRPTTFPYAEAVARFGRAVGAARMGSPQGQVEAGEEIGRLKELQAAYLASPDGAYWAEQIGILIDSASGWLAHARGDDRKALGLLRAAADVEDASEKHVAMENRLFPAREQLASLLLDLGQAEQALAEFEASLKNTPNRLRGFYGAARAAEAAGQPGVAARYREQLRSLTAGSDGRRAEVSWARSELAAATAR